MLREFLECIEDVAPNPRLMPLDEGEKHPKINNRCPLDSEKAQHLLVNGEEAINRIRKEGKNGFFIYAGKPEHNTEHLVFADRDEPDRWPSIKDTLRVLSGSGTGEHETYINAGDVQNAESKGSLKRIGGIRAENWGVVTPGSVHPSGGIYSIVSNTELAELHPSELPQELRPAPVGDSTGDNEHIETDVDIPSLSGDFDPDTVKNELGYPLMVIRFISDSLDRKLTELRHTEHPSVSEVDQSTVRLLTYWRFDEEDISKILRVCRTRKKLRRDDYVCRTITRTTVGIKIDEELFEPLVDSAVENDNRPPVSSTSLAEARDALQKLGGRATTTEIVESPYVDWDDCSKASVRKRLTRALNVLNDAGYVKKEVKSARGSPYIWIEQGLDDLALPTDDTTLPL
jgi:hypothetical protein